MGCDQPSAARAVALILLGLALLGLVCSLGVGLGGV
jgi:hypothetical protein